MEKRLIKRIKFLWSFVGKYKLKFVILLGSIVVTTCIVAFFPYLQGKIVDTLFYSENKNLFYQILFLYFFLFLCNQFLHFILQMTNVDLRTSFLFDIKRHIYRNVLSSKCFVLSNAKSGDVIHCMNQDVDEVMNLIYSDVFYGISALLDLIVCMLIMIQTNAILASFVFILAFITFVFGKILLEKVGPLQKNLTKMTAQNESWLFEILTCMRDLRLLGATKRSINKYLQNVTSILRVKVRKEKYDVLFESGTIGMQNICTVALYALSAFLIIRGNLTLGSVVACIDYFKRIALMLYRISQRFISLPKRFVSIDRIMEWDNIEKEQYYHEKPHISIKEGCVEFHNVSFYYEDGRTILDNFSLKIGAGEHIALVGKSGAGKSTISSLLCRLYDPVEGKITVDGIDLREFSLHDLRSQIGIAHQETIIFQATIRYNLVFSENKEKDTEIWKVLKLVQLDEIVRRLPGQLDTVLVKEHLEISGGQAQRLIFARLALKQPKVLIMDETTSALDIVTEKNILNIWDELFVNCTKIIIAHRFSTITVANKIACIDDGKLIDFGTKTELLERCPFFVRLYNDGIEVG